MYRPGPAARRADLLPALPRPQRPCPVKAPSLPPPGGGEKSRRSPRTAPVATRSRNPRRAARAARPLLPQVSTPRRLAGKARWETRVGPRPTREWLVFGGAEVRVCGVDVCRSRGAAQESWWDFQRLESPCNFAVMVLEGIGASTWLQLRICFFYFRGNRFGQPIASGLFSGQNSLYCMLKVV